MIELPADIASILGLLMLIILPIFLYILVRVVSPKHSLYNYLIKPPQIQLTESSSKESELWQNIRVKLGLVYLGLALFMVSFILGEFYEVLFDMWLPVTQGSTGEVRTISSLVFMTPFNAGWVGSLPWYGQLPAPAGFGSYHDSWGWIFTTAAYTDNPNFLGTIVSVLLIISLGVGTVFLAPLTIKRIRHAFLPSIFVFTTGMLVFTKTIVGGFAHAVALAIGAQVQYGIRTVTGSMIPDLNEVLAFGLLFTIGFYLLFLLIGQRLWRIHYNDVGSRLGFLLYVTAIYWIGLLVTIMVV